MGPHLKKFSRDECFAIAVACSIDANALLGTQRHRWKRDQVEILRDSGAINVEKLELIDGELYDKSGEPRLHVNARHQAAIRLGKVFGIDRVVQHCTVSIATEDRLFNDPEVDLIVTESCLEAYRNWPGPADVLLLAEVSDVTLAFDLVEKARLYTHAGFTEYWVVDLIGRRLIVHRGPAAERYSSIVSYDVGESVAPLAAPDSRVAVASLF